MHEIRLLFIASTVLERLMRVDWDVFVPIVVAVLGLVGAGLQRQTGLNRGRRRIKADLEILGLLPQELPDRQMFEEHISQCVQDLLQGRSSGLNASGLPSWGLSPHYSWTAVALIVPGFIWGGWWWIAAAIGVFSLAITPGLTIDVYNDFGVGAASVLPDDPADGARDLAEDAIEDAGQ